MSFDQLPTANQQILLRLRSAARLHSASATQKKKAVLLGLAKELLDQSDYLIAQNQLDLDSLPADTKSSFRDRLLLNKSRIDSMADSLKQVAALADPVGEIVEERILSNQLKVQKKRAPLGLIFMIFESRPNVITEAFSLAFMSGNGILLRGGSESKHSAKVIYAMIQKSLKDQGFTDLPFSGLEDYDRKLVDILLTCKDQIDVVVPRGGDALIAHVQKTSLIPIIKNDRGMCHAYIAEDADLKMAVEIVKNGKTQRPGVCNSLETVLVNKKIAHEFIPALYAATEDVKLEWRADAESVKVLNANSRVRLADESDWSTEHLSQILNCKIVDDLDEALAHIEKHGSKHSEVIVTKDEKAAHRFMQQVDAAAVYWNASSRFTDGYELGLGGELGISTQKLHVRGPVGLKELTSTRWYIFGQGQIRP